MYQVGLYLVNYKMNYLRAFIILCTISFTLYYFFNEDNSKAVANEITINYSLFDDILGDTLGISDGFYLLDNNLVFISTDTFNKAFSKTKTIFIFNKYTRKATVYEIDIFSWAGVHYDYKHKVFVESMKNLKHLNDEYDVIKYKRFINKIKKYNASCRINVEYVLEEKYKNG